METGWLKIERVHAFQSSIALFSLKYSEHSEARILKTFQGDHPQFSQEAQ